MKLEGKVAIVTGSGQGVGRAIALELASHGCKVVTNNRKKGSTSDQFMQGSPEDWAKKSPEEKADIEKKLSKEKQLNRKYELAKEKQRLQREIDYVQGA